MIHLAYPIFLTAGALLILPAVLHLLKNKTNTETVFPSLFFLSGYTVSASRRNYIRKWILLILRLSAVAAMALIFAWPYISAAKLDTEEASVILVDASFSTQADDVNVWLVKTLNSELDKVTDENPAMMGLVTDKILWTKEFYTSKEVLEAFYKQNSHPIRRSNFREAFVNADARLGKRNAKKRKIIVIGDRQRLPWNDVDLSRKLRFTDSIVHHVYPAERGALSNISINSASLRELSLAKAESCILQCSVTNYSDNENTVTLDARFGDSGKVSEAIKLKPSETKKIDLEIELSAPVTEPLGGSVTLVPETPERDMIKVDNVRYFAYNPAERSSVAKGRNLRSDASVFLNTALTDARTATGSESGTAELKYTAEYLSSDSDDGVPDLYIAEGAIADSQETYTSIRKTLEKRGSAVIVYNDSKKNKRSAHPFWR